MVIGAKQFVEALGAFGRYSKPWLLVGAITGIPMAAVAFAGTLAHASKMDIWYAAYLLLSGWVWAISAALCLDIALVQFRAGVFDKGAAKKIWPRRVGLATLGTASAAASYGYAKVIHLLSLDPIIFNNFVFPILSLPFILTLPTLLDQKVSPVTATWQSIRTCLPNIVGIFVAYLLVGLFIVLIAAPCGCIVMQASFFSSMSIVSTLLILCISTPLYYLTVAAIYRRVNQEGPPLLNNDLAPKSAPMRASWDFKE